MNIKKVILNLILISFLLVGYSICNSTVLNYRKQLPAESRRAEALMVSPTLLKVISGEFKGLWADYLLLKASIFLGGYHKSTPEDWEVIYLLFKQSLTLDPHFFQTCYYTQAFLAWRETMHEKAINLLRLCKKHRYWDWEPAFYIGFDYFYFLKNNHEAARYMEEAAQLPGAPPLVASLGARLSQKTGQTKTAIALLHMLYDRTKDKDAKKLLQKRIEAHLGILSLEHSIALYTKKYGKRPSSLNELITQGIIDKLPENRYTEQYIYDVKTGRISFDR